MYVFVGNRSLFGEGGITVFRYDQKERELKNIGTKYPEISAGFLCVDERNGRLFCVNERLESGGVPGGQILCFDIDSNKGALTLLSKANTHTVLPCYISYDPDKSRIYVCNHAKRDWTLKLKQAADGTFYGEKDYDDAAFEVFDVQADGTISGPTECWIAPFICGADNPHLHSITYDEKNQQFYVCDTGSNAIHTLVEGENGKIYRRATVEPTLNQSAPRYGALHPFLPIVYFNSEIQNALFVYKIQEGNLIPLQTIPVVEQNADLPDSLGQSAIAINRTGTVLYALVRETCSVSVFSVSAKGELRQKQSFPVGSESPRDLAIMPDGKSMVITCSTGKAVVCVQIDDEGFLYNRSIVEASLPSPGCVVFCDLTKKYEGVEL